MERLTLDKDVKDMGYMDLAHNMTFAKDGEIWYHNFTDEISLRNLIRRLCENFNIDIEKDDDLFDDAMVDWLGSEEPGSVESLLALLNFVFIGYDGLRARLKYYEDLAELGRLIELPCKLKNVIDVIFSHNEIVTLMCDGVDENGTRCYLHFWHGMAWNIPKEYLELQFVKIHGVVSDKPDTLYVEVDAKFTSEAAEVKLKELEGAE